MTNIKTSSRVPDVSVLVSADDAARLASTNPTGALQALMQYERERQAANGVSFMTTTNAITAHAGGGQGSAVPLTTKINRVTTVGTAADSVLLPAALAGMSVIVINAAAANAMAVFPATGDAINALAANASISVAANKVIEFFCAVTGVWNSVLTA